MGDDIMKLGRQYGLLRYCPQEEEKGKSASGTGYTKVKKTKILPLQQKLKVAEGAWDLKKPWLNFGKCFLNLPLEIRRIIYESLFKAQYYIPVSSTGELIVLEKTDPDLKKVLMLLEHKRLGPEVLEAYISTNSFLVDIGVIVQFLHHDWSKWITNLCVVVPVWDEYKCIGSKNCTCGGSMDRFIDFEREKLRLVKSLPRLKNLQVTMCVDIDAEDLPLDVATKCHAFAMTLLKLYEKGILTTFTLRIWDGYYDSSDSDAGSDDSGGEQKESDGEQSESDSNFDTRSIAEAPFISTKEKPEKLSTKCDTKTGETGSSAPHVEKVKEEFSGGHSYTEVDVTYWLDEPDMKRESGYRVHSKHHHTNHPKKYGFDMFYNMIQSELRYRRKWSKDWMQHVLNDDKLAKFFGQAEDEEAGCGQGGSSQ